jgi:hypothetical protein
MVLNQSLDVLQQGEQVQDRFSPCQKFKEDFSLLHILFLKVLVNAFTRLTHLTLNFIQPRLLLRNYICWRVDVIHPQIHNRILEPSQHL